MSSPSRGTLEGVPTGTSSTATTEIASNRDVVGNLNSNYAYVQTPEKDNGNKNVGLDKMASNKYLEKIAFMSFGKQLASEVRHSTAMGKVGIAAGATGLALSASRTIDSAKSNMARSKREANSLKALNSINRSLSTNQLAPSMILTQRPRGK